MRPRPRDALALLDILATRAPDVSQYLSPFISDEPFILIYIMTSLFTMFR